MKLQRTFITAIAFGAGLSAAARAGEANTSAAAGSYGRRSGTAAATADYHGNGPGYADTRTRTGTINLAQGVAIGFDRDGLSLSTSYAVAPRLGPAVAGTFNMNVGLDGAVATSVGRTVARGDSTRTVSASGGTGTGPGPGAAWATAGGRTGPHGRVVAMTRSNHRHTPLRWVVRHAGRTRRLRGFNSSGARARRTRQAYGRGPVLLGALGR